jgi:hypothetical protein
MRHPIINMISVAFALVFCQAPEFMQQYYQRIGGAADELQRIVQHFEDDTRRSGHEPSAALGIMSNNSEPLVRDQATRMKENIARRDRLREQQEKMKDQGAFARFPYFLANYDQPLVERTWKSYAWAFPLTIEGALFAIVGFFAMQLLLVGAFHLRWQAAA